ncbi:hypothetical protein SAY87_018114 [Trapa incisa]|uniref:Uncharacterized protein n=1 Tax=Trapa incisa TaxID=236973 RepID=A0AAN7L1W5_9MYRT|nr:hypothetical protein SAY87_018114 [Trapa incisa]
MKPKRPIIVFIKCSPPLKATYASGRRRRRFPSASAAAAATAKAMLLQQQQLIMMSRGLESSHGDVTRRKKCLISFRLAPQGGGGGLRSGSGSSCHLTLEYQMGGLTVAQMAASSTKRCQKMLPPTLPLWTPEFLLPISQLNINPPLVSLGHVNMNSHN